MLATEGWILTEPQPISCSSHHSRPIACKHSTVRPHKEVQKASSGLLHGVLFTRVTMAMALLCGTATLSRKIFDAEQVNKNRSFSMAAPTERNNAKAAAGSTFGAFSFAPRGTGKLTSKTERTFVEKLVEKAVDKLAPSEVSARSRNSAYATFANQENQWCVRSCRQNRRATMSKDSNSQRRAHLERQYRPTSPSTM